MDMEILALYLFGAGLVVATLGHIFLIIRGWQVSGWWALFLLFSPVGLLFLIFHFRKAWLPIAVMLLGVATIASPFVLSHFIKPDLGPYHSVDPEGHLVISLNGWDRTDYSILRHYPEAYKLQMSNADVNDQTLEYIRDMKDLRELELDRSKITDAGLAVLAGMPHLEVLKLRDTKVTEKGFQDHIVPLASLKLIDLRGTEVSLASQAAWRKAVKGRKFLKE
jgi:hypothetical protein